MDLSLLEFVVGLIAVVAGWVSSLWIVYSYLDGKVVKLRTEVNSIKDSTVERAHVENSIEKLEKAIVHGLNALRTDINRTHDRIDKLMSELVAEKREGR